MKRAYIVYFSSSPFPIFFLDEKKYGKILAPNVNKLGLRRPAENNLDLGGFYYGGLFNKRIPTLLHKRIPIHKRFSSDMNGFHGDTFSNGFGDFMTAKKRLVNSFHGDTFSDGFGDFMTAKKRLVNSFHGDTFSDGFGDFMTAKKKRMINSFHGDTFSDGFGDFATV